MNELLKDVIHEKVETSWTLRQTVKEHLPPSPDRGKIADEIVDIFTDFINQNYTLKPNKL